VCHITSKCEAKFSDSDRVHVSKYLADNLSSYIIEPSKILDEHYVDIDLLTASCSDTALENSLKKQNYNLNRQLFSGLVDVSIDNYHNIISCKHCKEKYCGMCFQPDTDCIKCGLNLGIDRGIYKLLVKKNDYCDTNNFNQAKDLVISCGMVHTNNACANHKSPLYCNDCDIYYCCDCCSHCSLCLIINY
jgi:hypothetical protein